MSTTPRRVRVSRAKESLRLYVDSLKCKIERLQAIVNKLDLTDDGIPITPRMEVWRTGTITYSNGATLTITAQRSSVELRIPGGDFVGSVHSTREAADAAKEKS